MGGVSEMLPLAPVCILLTAFTPTLRSPAAISPLSVGRSILPLMVDEALGYKIVKGKRIPLDSSGFDAARMGECIEPVDPLVGLTVLGAAALVASFGFNTARNRADSTLEGGNVPRRRALTWLGLQIGAAFYIGPQLSNPCSNINSEDRWSGGKRS